MKTEIISQYKASLKMLLNTIQLCPESLWENEVYENAFWRIVYHTLFYTSLYLSKKPTDFSAWSNHIESYNCLGKLTFENKPILIEKIYTKEDLSNYLKSILNHIDKSINEMEEQRKSEFYWIPGNELVRHLYNIRHIQHHTGQLVERLHCKGINGIKWEGNG